MSEFICACGCPLDAEGFCPACDLEEFPSSVEGAEEERVPPDPLTQPAPSVVTEGMVDAAYEVLHYSQDCTDTPNQVRAALVAALASAGQEDK